MPRCCWRPRRERPHARWPSASARRSPSVWGSTWIATRWRVRAFSTSSSLTVGIARHLRRCWSRGRASARGGAPTPERIIVEFVSANPTGPMHVGHARNAAYGDALARVLAFHGHQVEREFYVNDAGSQVLKLGESISAIARGEEVPEDGYRGDYVATVGGGGQGDALRRPRRARARRARGGGGGGDGGQDATLAWRLPCAELRPLGVRERASRRSGGRARRGGQAHKLGGSRAGLAGAEGPHLPQRGRPVVAHHRVRRRQGPRAGALKRRAHLLRLRHRLPPGQARAWLRPSNRRVGRRPPRLCGAHEGGL